MIFPRGARLPSADDPPLQSTRSYRPVHNIGHFRYLECSRVDDLGQPTGEINNWGQVLFPFDPQLRDRSDLTQEPVQQFSGQPDLSVKEEYTCDSGGNLKVKISAEPAGYSREFSISQFSGS